ncbi:MAG: diol dehydratase small subunit [Lachnospiraceae bacterium]|nr:diol dehydratase small subunit [Lachnospiraceae bacterium]
MNQEELTKLVNDVLKSLAASGTVNMGGSQTAAPAGGKVTKDQYPLAEKAPHLVKTVTGVNFSDITFEKVINGEITGDDLRISPEVLEMQAQVSESAGNAAFATNLRRAKELIPVPDDRLIEIYNALRPYRSTKQELLDIADELEGKYNAKVCAAFVRESANVYEIRDRLRKD